MAERDKTSVYLERVRTLEERARAAMGFATGIAGVVAAIAAVFRQAAGFVTAAGLVASVLSILLAAYNYQAGERLWERLVRDPMPKQVLLVLLYGAGLAAILATILALWALGLWK